MRLTGLRLQRYGPFADTEISLDPAPGRVNLLLAPNGAGKSVLRAAWGDLLFGIGAQTPLGFRHGYTGMQVSARGMGPDGAPFAFGRRKGQGNTLLDADGNPGDPATLRRLLGTADRALLERLFALDTELLRGGGHALLTSGGVLSEALLAAAGGVREAQRVRKRLEDGRDSLAPKRRSPQRPFYLALDRWSASRKAGKAEVLHPDRWAREEAARDAARQRQAEAQAAVTDATGALRRLERVRRVRPLLARLEDAEAWLRAHPDAPVLPESLAERFPAARAALVRAAEGCERAEKHRDELRAQAMAVQPDDTLLGREAEIEALAEAAGAAERARTALPGARGDAAAKQDAVAECGKQLGAATTPNVPPRATLARVRRLLAEHTRRADALRDVPLQVEEARRRLEEAETALARAGVAEDVEGLAELLGEATRDGDPLSRAASFGKARGDAEEALHAILTRLPAPLREPGAIERAAVPEPEAVERLNAAREDAGAAHEAAQAAVARVEAELTAVEARRRNTGSGSLPDDQAVAAARAHRDLGWHLVFRRAFGDGADPAAEQSFAGTEPLALAYAHAVAAADAVADRRTAEASRVAEAAHLAEASGRLAAELDGARATANDAGRRFRERQAEWYALSASLHLPPGAGVAELRRVLNTRTTALDALRAFRAADGALGEVRAAQDAAGRRIARHLGIEPAPGLPDILHAANARLRQARNAERERGALGAVRHEARTVLARAEAEHRALLQRQAGWQAEWQDALHVLGRPGDEKPDDTATVVELLEGLGPLLKDAKEAQERVAAFEDEMRAFAERWTSLSTAMAWGPAGLDPFEGARILVRQSREEAGRRERRALLDRQAEAAEAALSEARREQDAAELAWRALLAECGTAAPEEAEARIALSGERARRADAAARLRDELAEAGDGLPLGTLMEEAASFPPEHAEAALEEARRNVERYAREAQDAAGEAARLGADLERLAGENAALRHRAEEESAGALLGATLDDALLMHTAATLLEEALKELEKEGDDALLRRIGAVFAELTDNAYLSTSSAADERGAARLVLHSAAGEDLGVEHLSEGTRDQLFLALRLVAIADHVAGGSPLPLLGDDILQTFDDRRAAAAFRVLAEFSETVQVVLLSHHPHLADVARNALPAGALHVEDLAAMA